MATWRITVECYGIDLGDGQPALLDLRFADDILLFGFCQDDIVGMLDELKAALMSVGLVLNATKTVVLTNEAQPPTHIALRDGEKIQVLPRDCGHKWLGCILSAEGSRGQHLDFDFHLQAASRAFFAHKAVFCNRKVSLKHRLRYFHAMVTPVACFGCGHRTIRKHHLEQLDIEFRKLVRRIVGPPVETDWAAPWHEVLHTWNERVQVQIQRAGIPIWSRVCLTQYWKFAGRIAKLPPQRWAKRLFLWNPVPVELARLGRPAASWSTQLERFCRYKQLGHWHDLAADEVVWNFYMEDFIHFCGNDV